MNTALEIPPVVKTLSLPCPPADAFEAFTGDFGRWWPYATHSLGRDVKVAGVVLEGGPGGRLYEIWKDGSEHLWGRITTWDPPHELSFSWHVGREPALATNVRVSIRGQDGGSLIQLTHSEWEKLGADASPMRERYESGWVEVFERRFGDFARTIGTGAGFIR